MEILNFNFEDKNGEIINGQEILNNQVEYYLNNDHFQAWQKIQKFIDDNYTYKGKKINPIWIESLSFLIALEIGKQKFK